MYVCVNEKGPETESRPVCDRTVRKHCELGLRHKESGHGERGEILDYITPSQSLHREPVISTGAGTALRANRAAVCEPVCCLRTQVIGENRFA